MATAPAPPGWLSTITCWPQSCVNLSASTRAHTSGLEPGPTEVTILTGPDGKLCARAPFAANASAAPPARNERRPIRRAVMACSLPSHVSLELHLLQHRRAQEAQRIAYHLGHLEMIVA